MIAIDSTLPAGVLMGVIRALLCGREATALEVAAL
jgi:hypothetical protein